MEEDKNTKELFQKLFFSNLRNSEIKNRLGLSNEEYSKLVDETKKELGLPDNYRRTPNRYENYNKYSYYILEEDLEKNDYRIILYRPTLKLCKEELLKIMNKKTSIHKEYSVEKASDDNLKRLISILYFDNYENWEDILIKLKLPYHKFYQLLNELKKDHKVRNNRTNRRNRFVYEFQPTQKYVIVKNINKERINFGYYDTEEIAIRVRDYLEENNWDMNLLNKNKDKIINGS